MAGSEDLDDEGYLFVSIQDWEGEKVVSENVHMINIYKNDGMMG